MKKKIFCLLLALVVTMIVAPLTAFADDTHTVPEEYRGMYKQPQPFESHEDVWALIYDDSTITINIPSYNINEFNWGLDHYDNSNKTIYFGDKDVPEVGWVSIKINEDNSIRLNITYPDNTKVNLPLTKVTDTTNSTLSTGSDWIIPVVGGLLALGAVIFIGRRKIRKNKA